MIYRRIARRYAAALFQAASENGIVDQVEQDLHSAQAGIVADPAIQRMFSHPEVPSARKQEILNAVFAGLARLSLEFLALLVRRRRLQYLGDIIEEFRGLADAARGVVRAQAVSAIAMSDQQRERLRRALERRTGKTVSLQYEVDSALLAGIVVTIEDEVIDASARGRLDKLRELLAEARFRGLGQ